MPILRNYQYDCVASVFREWEKVQCTLATLPTGTGKSVCFAEIVRRVAPKRSMIVAHRSELITQASKHIGNLGITTEIEMGMYKTKEQTFSNTTAIIASVQTLISGPKDGMRMKKFDPNSFDCLIIDECHHSTSKSYKSILNHFCKNPNLKVVGFTATPDRSDEEALGQVFQSVAYQYELDMAINEGWLCPIDQQMIQVGGLDFSHIKTTAGDLNGAELAAVMEDEKNIHPIVSPIIDIVGNRKTILFTSSVKHAEKCTDVFNRHRSGMAAWISGKTPEDQRAQILKDFASGKTQVFVNVGIATEGFDAPNCEVVAIARPTKSRSLYVQMVGRGTRPLPGVLEGLNSAYERKQAIEISAKPSVLIIDLVGNAGKHKLITSADILGGKYSDEVREAAIKKAKKEKVRMADALKESEAEIRKRIEMAKQQEEARKAKLVAKAQFTAQKIDPFDAFGISKIENKQTRVHGSLSLKQRNIILKMGLDPDKIPYDKAAKLIQEQVRRWKNNLATAKQCQILMKFGYETRDMTMKQASAILDELAKNKWRKVANA